MTRGQTNQCQEGLNILDARLLKLFMKERNGLEKKARPRHGLLSVQNRSGLLQPKFSQGQQGEEPTQGERVCLLMTIIYVINNLQIGLPSDQVIVRSDESHHDLYQHVGICSARQGVLWLKPAAERGMLIDRYSIRRLCDVHWAVSYTSTETCRESRTGGAADVKCSQGHTLILSHDTLLKKWSGRIRTRSVLAFICSEVLWRPRATHYPLRRCRVDGLIARWSCLSRCVGRRFVSPELGIIRLELLDVTGRCKSC